MKCQNSPGDKLHEMSKPIFAMGKSSISSIYHILNFAYRVVVNDQGLVKSRPRVSADSVRPDQPVQLPEKNHNTGEITDVASAS